MKYLVLALALITSQAWANESVIYQLQVATENAVHAIRSCEPVETSIEGYPAWQQSGEPDSYPVVTFREYGNWHLIEDAEAFADAEYIQWMPVPHIYSGTWQFHNENRPTTYGRLDQKLVRPVLVIQEHIFTKEKNLFLSYTFHQESWDGEGGTRVVAYTELTPEWVSQ